jgi:uncharacterized protein (DUF952 family)
MTGDAEICSPSVGSSNEASQMELYHVLTQDAWDSACQAGQYAPPELYRDGFLHCCTPDQLDFVLQRHFAGATGLLVLSFDTAKVSAMVEWVRSEPGQNAFPHLHGPIPCGAVLRAEPLCHTNQPNV